MHNSLYQVFLACMKIFHLQKLWKKWTMQFPYYYYCPVPQPPDLWYSSYQAYNQEMLQMYYRNCPPPTYYYPPYCPPVYFSNRYQCSSTESSANTARDFCPATTFSQESSETPLHQTDPTVSVSQDMPRTDPTVLVPQHIIQIDTTVSVPQDMADDAHHLAKHSSPKVFKKNSRIIYDVDQKQFSQAKRSPKCQTRVFSDKMLLKPACLNYDNPLSSSSLTVSIVKESRCGTSKKTEQSVVHCLEDLSIKGVFQPKRQSVGMSVFDIDVCSSLGGCTGEEPVKFPSKLHRVEDGFIWSFK